MTGTLGRTSGGFRVARAVRTAIWVALALFAAFLTGAALAGQGGSKLAPLARPGFGPAPAIGPFEDDKAGLFRRPTPGDLREEITCLALNIYHEARSEPDEGKLAVGHVVMNRVASPRFPDTVCDVVRQGGELELYRCQFTWWCDGLSDMPTEVRHWEISNEFALAIYWGRSQDPTEGALWYHADYVSPLWRHAFEEGPRIGRHIFYRHPVSETLLAFRLGKR